MEEALAHPYLEQYYDPTDEVRWSTRAFRFQLVLYGPVWNEDTSFFAYRDPMFCVFLSSVMLVHSLHLKSANDGEHFLNRL